MSITLKKDESNRRELQLGLECPYCNVYSRMAATSVPDVSILVATRPKHVGIVHQCDACNAPVFLRYAVKEIRDDEVILNQNFVELERPKERFAFSYLPQQTETLFREALSCYSANNYNAFASMCRRSAHSAFDALGEGGKMQAFEELMVAQEIAEIDDATLDPIKAILFEISDDSAMPILNRAQAGVLLEILKDIFYQCFVRRGKLTRAIRVRNLFGQEPAAPTAANSA